MTYRFDLSFDASREGDPPFTPTWDIYVKQGNVNKQGAQMVTPGSCHESDIDQEIEKLINELNLLRKNVKNKYKALHKKKAK